MNYIIIVWQFIKKHQTLCLALICLILAAFLVGYIDYTKKEIEARKTAENNVKILMTDNTTFKTKLGLQASEAEALRLTINQFKKLRSEDALLIKDLKVKLKDAEFLIKIGTKTEYKFVTQVRDSLIRDTIYPCFDYTNKWYHIDGCVKNKQLIANTYFLDSLSIVGSPIKKGWFIFKKTIGSKITVANMNPSSKITYNEFILF